MGSASDLNSPKNTNIVGAGVAGGGVGTLIAAFAESLPDDTGFKSVLTISAPLITIAISGIWLFFKAVYVDQYAASKKHKSKHKHINSLLEDARKTEEQILNNEYSSPEHKKRIREKVEKLEAILFDSIIDNVDYT